MNIIFSLNKALWIKQLQMLNNIIDDELYQNRSKFQKSCKVNWKSLFDLNFQNIWIKKRNNLTINLLKQIYKRFNLNHWEQTKKLLWIIETIECKNIMKT